MDLERERGITIKAQSVTLDYKAQDGEVYQLNFIDTPGHVDFSYEVSRSLASCEGALLVVDAGQGVEAQTVANCYTAIEMDLEVLPILNKIDLPQADPDRVCEEIEHIIGIDATEAVTCSAKTGIGIEDVLVGCISASSIEVAGGLTCSCFDAAAAVVAAAALARCNTWNSFNKLPTISIISIRRTSFQLKKMFFGTFLM